MKASDTIALAFVAEPQPIDVRSTPKNDKNNSFPSQWLKTYQKMSHFKDFRRHYEILRDSKG